MTTLTMLSFQEKGHGLFKKKEETCSRKHDEKKSWRHEAPSIQNKNREKKIAHVQRKKMERDG